MSLLLYREHSNNIICVTTDKHRMSPLQNQLSLFWLALWASPVMMPAASMTLYSQIFICCAYWEIAHLAHSHFLRETLCTTRLTCRSSREPSRSTFCITWAEFRSLSLVSHLHFFINPLARKIHGFNREMISRISLNIAVFSLIV